MLQSLKIANGVTLPGPFKAIPARSESKEASDSVHLGSVAPSRPVYQPFVDPLEGVAPASMSPIGEIFKLPAGQIREELIASQPQLHATGLRHRHFLDAMEMVKTENPSQHGKNLDDLVTAWSQKGPLEAGEATLLMQAYGRLGAPQKAIDLYRGALASNPDLGKYEVPLELYLQSLAATGRDVEVIARGETLMQERLALLPEAEKFTPRQILSCDLTRTLQLGSPVLESLAQAYRGLHDKLDGAVQACFDKADLLSTVEGFSGWKSPEGDHSRARLNQAARSAILATNPEQFVADASRLCGRPLKGPVAAALVEKLRLLGEDLRTTRVPAELRPVLGDDLLQADQTALETARDYQLASFRGDFQAQAGQALLQDERALGHAERVACLEPIVLACGPHTTAAASNDPQWLERKAVTDKIFSIGRRVDQETRSSFVAGSWRFVDRGGTVDMPVNRPAIHAYRHLNAQLGLDQMDNPANVQRVCQTLHKFIDDQFELVDPQTGQRSMENLQSMVHHVRDQIAERRHDVCQSKVLGSSDTNPHLELLFGKGDCRATSINFALSFGIWKKDQETSCLRKAVDAALRGDTQASKLALQQAEEWSRLQILMVDLTFVGNVRLETDGQGKPLKYRLLTDSNGNPLASQDLLLDSTGKPQAIEDHSLPVLAHLDKDGLVDKLTAVDPFYRNLYQLGWLELHPEDVLDTTRGFRLGTMGVAASDGTAIPIWGQPTAYSGSPVKPCEGEYGQESFGGRAVSVGDPTPFLQKHSAFDDFADATVGLVTATGERRLLQAVMSERLQEATLGIRHRWTQALLSDQHSPSKPFVGWAAEKLVVDPALQSMDPESLQSALRERGFAGTLSAAKLDSIRRAPVGTVVLSPALQGGLSPQSLAVETIGLSLYLDDMRNGEEMGTVLSNLLRGRDPEGFAMLLKAESLAHLAAALPGLPNPTGPAKSWHSLYELHPEKGLDAERWSAACASLAGRPAAQVIQDLLQGGSAPDPVGQLTVAHYLQEFRAQEDPAAVLQGLTSGQDSKGLHQLALLGHLASQTAGRDQGGDAGLTTGERHTRARAALEWLNGTLGPL